MKILRAVESDSGKISELIAKEFPYTNSSEGKVLERIRSGNSRILKAVEGRKLLGFTEFLVGGTHGRVLGLCVAEEERGRGIGRELLKSALNEMERMGAHRVSALVNPEKRAAVKIYSSLGFREKSSGIETIGGFPAKELELTILEDLQIS